MARSLRIALVALIAAPSFAALAAGCGSFASGSLSGASDVPADNLVPYEPDASDAGYFIATEPADTANVATTQGSPLCNATLYVGGCYPDLPTTAQACGLAPDGGASDSAVPDGSSEGADSNHASEAATSSLLACHVAPAGDAGDAGVNPVCTSAGLGTEGSACAHGTDCAAGYECVEGACRHYCCASASACSAADFCDVQPSSDTGTLVPVCMPIVPCTLLLGGPAGSCSAANETCSVVRDDGTTGCETIGAAQAGAPCDTAHCAAGLVCLGAVGARRCYTLCSTSTMAECTGGQQCTTGLTLFSDPAVGWCH
jgi:hypothetical protein